MSSFNTSTDWTRNFHQESIVYQDAYGNITEVTLEQFLADNPAHTAEMFLEIKKISDGIFEAEDKAERSRSKKELPLVEWMDECATESLEEHLVERTEHEARQAYLRRCAELEALLPEAMAALTETQRRRLFLHKVQGLTTRAIADLEGAKQPSVVESITSAGKKIRRFLLKKGFGS